MLTLEKLIKTVPDIELIGKNGFFIKNALPLNEAGKESLTWIKDESEKALKYIQNTLASVIVISNKLIFDETKYSDKVFIKTKTPKLTFIRILKEFFVEDLKPEIHISAIISNEAVIGKDCFIGPNVYIGKCKIGKGTIIHGNCFIYDNVIIGDNVTINANTTIGSEGYGYERNKEGEFERFPHIGGVLIGNNVDIGSNTAIDRGALGNTIIEEGVKIDNLVHIAHNVVIGKHSAIIANSMIAGSVKIGSFSWVAPSASILNQLDIGKEATIGMGAVVVKNVNNKEVVAGVPAKPLEEFKAIQKFLKENGKK